MGITLSFSCSCRTFSAVEVGPGTVDFAEYSVARWSLTEDSWLSWIVHGKCSFHDFLDSVFHGHQRAVEGMSQVIRHCCSTTTIWTAEMSTFLLATFKCPCRAVPMKKSWDCHKWDFHFLWLGLLRDPVCMKWECSHKLVASELLQRAIKCIWGFSTEQQKAMIGYRGIVIPHL